MSTSGNSPMQPQYDPMSYLIGSLEPRVKAIEAWISDRNAERAAIKEALHTYAKRIGVILVWWGMGVVLVLYPKTIAATIADFILRAAE